MQAKSVAAQDCFDLFYSPLEHLGQLFCRDDWIVRVHKKYSLLLMKEPFAHMFVLSLSNLKADRTSAVKKTFCLAFHLPDVLSENYAANHEINLPYAP